MCGIFGISTSKPELINQANVRILGMFNESRGKTSCGITFDDEIYHGLGTEKLFTDFMKGRDFTATHNPLMFGHTRQASVGMAVNDFNVHPFGFGINRATGGYKFIGVHNGTIYNYKELAKKYGIELEQKYTNEYKVELTRTKIDSEVLLEILYRTGTCDVLSEYIGRAALIWTDTTEPNVTYLWSGKSRSSETYINGAQLEERPMNVWVQNKEVFYFSSMPESLQAIGATSKEVVQIEYNTVYKVTDGDFEAAQTREVSRLNAWHTETYVSPHSYNRHNCCAYDEDVYSGKLYGDENVKKDENKTLPATVSNSTAKNNSTVKLNIYNDTFALKNQNEYGNRIYTQKLRYFHKGHMITGVYHYVPDHGFRFLGINTKEATEAFNFIRGKQWIDGDFNTTEIKIEGGSYPINMQTSMTLFYFIDGIMVRDPLDYAATIVNPEWRKDYVKMSHMSVHPIIDMTYAHKTDSTQAIMKEGKMFTGTINGLSFEKTYDVVGGNLTKVTPKAPTGYSKVIEMKPAEVLAKRLAEQKGILATRTITVNEHDESVLEMTYQNILDFETKFQEHEELVDQINARNADKKAIDKEVEDKITEMMDSEITPCLMSFQNFRDELDLMPEKHPLVEETRKLMQTLITTITNYIK